MKPLRILSVHRPHLTQSHRLRAFTLVELLVVITIIAILVGIILAVTSKTKLSSQQAVCLSNMRQVGIAFQLYAGEHEYQLPARVITGDKWPLLMQDYLHTTKVYVAPGIESTTTDPTTLVSNTANNTSFIMNGFNDLGAYNDPSVVVRTVSIPLPSQTILLGTAKPADTNFYMDVIEGNQTGALDLTAYGEGSNYVFADGSSRFLKQGDYQLTMWYVNKDYVTPPTP